jgi:glycyl-tRNA synthetase beta chain
MSELLIELFSEEIPSRMQKSAGDDLKKNITQGLMNASLAFESAASFYTPRRLVLVVEGLAAYSVSKVVERRGPRSDAPEVAVNGFIKSTGLSESELEVRKEKNGEFFFAAIKTPGRKATEIVAEVLQETIINFPWGKSMNWGTSSIKWVRPLHNILCIISSETETSVVPIELDGIKSNNHSRGHRFMSGIEFPVSSFDDLRSKLKKAFVVLDNEERERDIWSNASNQAFALGLEVVKDPLLLTEVSGLVEWPNVLMGKIDTTFLDLPSEVLQISMSQHQKLFSVKNNKSGRIERFITVANVITPDNGELILAGNQKVLFARLSDAKFFWNNDLRIINTGMDIWIKKLGSVTFHNKLGTQKDRIDRLCLLAANIASFLEVDVELTKQAALFCKADLSSEMVYEFPELQGIMGSYYAISSGLNPDVALAIKEHYSPMGPSEICPRKPISVVIALADKIDILISFWKINEKPTGSRDPFALRRAALGVIRILIENSISLNLRLYFSNDLEPEVSTDLLSFIHDRLTVFLKNENVRYDAIEACLNIEGNDNIFILSERVKSLSDVLKSEEGINLAAGFKRVNNIITKAEKDDGVVYELDPDSKFFESIEEKNLLLRLSEADISINTYLKKHNFTGAMSALAQLRAPIDEFLEKVQVNSDNQIVRRNRLCLLTRVKTICYKVADLSLLEG